MSPKHRAPLLIVGLLLSGSGATIARAQVPGEGFRDCANCPEMVVLPGGSFLMGADSDAPAERPAHEVTLASFAVARTEVTRAQYAAYVEDTGRGAPGPCLTDVNRDGRWQYEADRGWADPGFPSGDTYPVTCMNWADASDFAAWLAQETGKPYRLLSEAEYEYALRGGTTTEYWWGDDKDAMCRYANGPDAHVMSLFPRWTGGAACEDGHDFLAPVASYQPNGYGLHDMAGNAWEWTADCFVTGYLVQPRDGSAYDNGHQCGWRTTRGGSFGYAVGDFRSAQRNWAIAPYMRGADVGFRVARDL